MVQAAVEVESAPLSIRAAHAPCSNADALKPKMFWKILLTGWLLLSVAENTPSATEAE